MTDASGIDAHDLDTCMCGDYRRQHVNGAGRCMLNELCTPTPCRKFRLFRPFSSLAQQPPSEGKS